jgi:hypothetical protein
MSEEYEQIREVLLALMCVGDKINYIYFCHGGYYRIYKTIVNEIEKEAVRIDGWGMCALYAVEHYQGELYVWERHYPRNDDRLEAMAKIINSKDTHHG